MTRRTRVLLLTAGVGSVAVAALHVAMAFSVRWCRFFGAPDWVLAAGLPARVGMVLLVAGAFGLFGRLMLGPLSRDASPRLLTVAIIGAIYTLRGLVLVPESLVLSGVVTLPLTIEPQMPFFSLTSLVIGVAHLAGAVGLHRHSPVAS
jgi:hypothetical protein